MNKLSKRKENIIYAIILIVIASYIFSVEFLSLNNTSNTQFYILFQISSALFATGFIFIVVVGFYYSSKHAIFLIDMYILSIPAQKINNQTFYCQVCKVVVDVDDIYCTNCGQQL